MSLDILGTQDEIRDKWYTRTSDGTLVEKPGLQIVVMMTMLTGVPEINERTAPLFWDRIYLYQKAIGAVGRKTVDGITSDWFMTPATVREFIGLRTNVSGKTDAQFRSFIGKISKEDATREWQRYEGSLTASVPGEE